MSDDDDFVDTKKGATGKRKVKEEEEDGAPIKKGQRKGKAELDKNAPPKGEKKKNDEEPPAKGRKKKVEKEDEEPQSKGRKKKVEKEDAKPIVKGPQKKKVEAETEAPRPKGREQKKKVEEDDDSPLATEKVEEENDSPLPLRRYSTREVDPARIFANAEALAAAADSDPLNFSNLSFNLDSANDSLLSADSPLVARRGAACDELFIPKDEDILKKTEKRGKKGKQGDEFEALRDIVKGAEMFMNSDIINDIKKDRCTMSTRLEAEQRIGSNMLLHVLTAEDDLELLLGSYSQAELWLLASPDFPLEDVYRDSLQRVFAHRKGNGTLVEGPTLNQCLAWLAHASQSELSSLLPGGECFSDAQHYMETKLRPIQLKLLQVKTSRRKQWAVHQTTRVLTLLTTADLRSFNADDRALLFFAVARLYIDQAADLRMKTTAHSFFRNLLSSCPSFSSFLPSLAAIFPLLTDSLHLLLSAVQGLRCGSCPPLGMLAVVTSCLIHKCERAECAPPADLSVENESIFVRTYIDVIIDTYHDVFDLVKEEKNKNNVRSFISLVNMALAPPVVKYITNQQLDNFTDTIDTERRTLLATSRPDDAIVATQMRSQHRRLEHAPRMQKGEENEKEVEKSLSGLGISSQPSTSKS